MNKLVKCKSLRLLESPATPRGRIHAELTVLSGHFQKMTLSNTRPQSCTFHPIRPLQPLLRRCQFYFSRNIYFPLKCICIVRETYQLQNRSFSLDDHPIKHLMDSRVKLPPEARPNPGPPLFRGVNSSSFDTKTEILDDADRALRRKTLSKLSNSPIHTVTGVNHSSSCNFKISRQPLRSLCWNK